MIFEREKFELSAFILVVLVAVILGVKRIDLSYNVDVY